MPQQFIHYLNHYGYLAIFIIVLLQEVGAPTPYPNELFTLFLGYLSYSGALKLHLVIPTVVSADFLGASTLYSIFYFFGQYIILHKPKWFPLSTEKINSVSARIGNGGLWSVFLGRITPIIRGYISLIAGLLHLKPKSYVPIVLITACLVPSTYILTGYFLGPYWSAVASKLGNAKYIVFFPIIIIACISLIRHYRKKKTVPATNDLEET